MIHRIRETVTTTRKAQTAFGRSSGKVARWSRPLALGVTVLGLVIFGWLVLLELIDPAYSPFIGSDRYVYHDAALRVLGGGSWFYPEQVTGQPYDVVLGHVMYPPAALVWFIPAAFLPDFLWWAIPIGIIAAVVIHHRPSPWGWAAMAMCLAYPWTAPLLMSGNPGLWIAAACALGTVWRPAFALILAKPSLFPFALLGIRDRGWWVIAVFGLVVSFATLPLTLQWVGVIVNARGQFSGPLYAIRDVGWMLLPLIAAKTSARPNTISSGGSPIAKSPR